MDVGFREPDCLAGENSKGSFGIGCLFVFCSGHGSIYPNAHFSEKDGRLYHQFHQISKEERENNVYWDGEHVIEAWDAHSAFFTVLCFFLKFYQKYDKIESHKRFTEEANRMLDLTLSDNLYSSVADYHNSKSNDFLNGQTCLK